MASPEPSTRPLTGIRVIEFGQYIAVPSAGQTLADLGADVIKVESPSGDVARHLGWTKDSYGPMFSAYNRGKRSIVLNLRDVAQLEKAKKLVATADVVIQNVRPGSLKKFGLDADQLRTCHPTLIYGQVSAFGQSGESAKRMGFDIAAQAESGLMSLNGEAHQPPLRIGFTVVDVLAAQTLVNGILAALFQRHRTNQGTTVDLSLIDVAIAALSNAWAEYRLLDKVPFRCGNGQPTVAPAAEVIPTRDGMVVISAYTQLHFKRLCDVINRPELTTDDRFSTNAQRLKNRPELLSVLKKAFSNITSETLCQQLTNAGIVIGVIRNLDEIKAGQAGVSKDLFINVHAPKRAPIPIPGLPFTLNSTPRKQAKLPALGEHTDEILASLV